MTTLLAVFLFGAGVLTGAVACALAFAFWRSFPMESPTQAPAPEVPQAPYRVIDRSDKAVAAMERLQKTSGPLPGTTVIYETQAPLPPQR